MTAVAEPTKKQKKAGRAGVQIDADVRVPFPETATDGQEALAPEVEKQPGEPGFDWQAEYPGEKVFIYTTPEGTQTSYDFGNQPYAGKVFGLAAISENRQPSVTFIQETREKDQFSQVLDMLKIVGSDNAKEVYGPMRSADLVEMWDKWSEWNRTNAGE